MEGMYLNMWKEIRGRLVSGYVEVGRCDQFQGDQGPDYPLGDPLDNESEPVYDDKTYIRGKKRFEYLRSRTLVTDQVGKYLRADPFTHELILSRIIPDSLRIDEVYACPTTNPRFGFKNGGNGPGGFDNNVNYEGSPRQSYDIIYVTKQYVGLEEYLQGLKKESITVREFLPNRLQHLSQGSLTEVEVLTVGTLRGILKSLVNGLRILKEKYRFQHGTLNLDAVVVSDGKFKLRKMGYSRIEIGDHVLIPRSWFPVNISRNFDRGGGAGQILDPGVTLEKYLQSLVEGVIYEDIDVYFLLTSLILIPSCFYTFMLSGLKEIWNMMWVNPQVAFDKIYSVIQGEPVRPSLDQVLYLIRGLERKRGVIEEISRYLTDFTM